MTVEERVHEFQIRRITEDRDRWKAEALRLERIVMGIPIVNYRPHLFVDFKPPP